MQRRGRRARPGAGLAGRAPACRRTEHQWQAPQSAASRDLHPSSRARTEPQPQAEGWMTETAVLICGPGGRDPEAIAELDLLPAALRPPLPQFDFATGYLEFARP